MVGCNWFEIGKKSFVSYSEKLGLIASCAKLMLPKASADLSPMSPRLKAANEPSISLKSLTTVRQYSLTQLA